MFELLQIFEFIDLDGNSFKWNINEVLRMLKKDSKRIIYSITKECVQEIFKTEGLKLEVNEEHIAEVDLNKPIIIAKHPIKGDSDIVIDGLHRLHRAKDLSVGCLAYVLTLEESREFLIS